MANQIKMVKMLLLIGRWRRYDFDNNDDRKMVYSPLGNTKNPKTVKHNVHVTLKSATQP